MKGVYKKYLNSTTGTTIFLEDETVELLGDVSANILHRLDDKLYCYSNNGFSEIASRRGGSKTEKEVESNPLVIVDATANTLDEEPGLDWIPSNEETKVNKKNKQNKQVSNEG